MGTKKRGDEEERTLHQNNSGSYMITLPIGVIRGLKWQKGQRVVVKKSGNKIVIEDWDK